jgi:hypothetical protein
MLIAQLRWTPALWTNVLGSICSDYMLCTNPDPTRVTPLDPHPLCNTTPPNPKPVPNPQP